MFVREEQPLFALSTHQRLELCLIEFDRLVLFAMNPACDGDEHIRLVKGKRHSEAQAISSSTSTFAAPMVTATISVPMRAPC
jgi:hypothetical protein